MSVSRRTFLSAAAAAALPAAAADRAAASDRLTLGFLGVGARAHQLIDSLLHVRRAEIVAVTDAYRGRVERAVARTEGRAKVVDDYRKILEDASIDAVVVATPDHWHAKQCIEALEAGKHVYCEKPLTYAAEEGLAIAAAVEKSGKKLQVGSQGVSSDIQRRAKKMIADGELGEITMIRANYNRNSAGGAWIYPIPPDASEETVDWDMFLGPARKRPFSLERFFRWRCYEDYSGGIATDLFVHLATTIHELMGVGAPSQVMAMGDLYRWRESREVPDTLNAILRYKEGFTVTLSSTFNNGTGGTGFEFLGTEGSLSIRSRSMTFQRQLVRENNDWIVASWPEELAEEFSKKEAATRPSLRSRPDPQEFKERGPSDTRKHLERFVEAVLEGRPIVEDAYAGHRAAACAHMVNRSAKTGRMALWDFEKDTIAT